VSGKLLPVAVLLAALTGLGGSIAWAVSESDDSSRAVPHMASAMMGFAPGGTARPVRGLADAKARAQRFADRLGLRAEEVMRFERNYYVELVDAEGRGATEVLVDPPTGVVSLEYGPAMMWNTRYGMMSGYGGMMGDAKTMRSMMGSAWGGMSAAPGYGMMGGGMMGGGMMGSAPPATPRDSAGELSAQAAQEIAQRWAQGLDPSLRAGEAESFPGYYTFHTLRGSRIEGMLSVHASTGAVMYHWWHGRFLSMME